MNMLGSPLLGPGASSNFWGRPNPMAGGAMLSGIFGLFQALVSLVMSLFAFDQFGGQGDGPMFSPYQNPGFGNCSCGQASANMSNFLGAGPGSYGGGGYSGGSAGGSNGNFAAGAPSNFNTSNLTGNASAQNFINKAVSHQGAPYVFGAKGPSAFDCSGLVYYSLNEAGVKVPRLTAEGYRRRYSSTAVSKEQLQPGDLVFFHSKNSRGIPPGQATHIEIYLGNGMTMGTDSPKEGAKVEPINWGTFIGGARVPELARSS